MLGEEPGTIYPRNHIGLSQSFNFFFPLARSGVREIREFLLNLQKTPHREMGLEDRGNKS